MGKVIKLGTYVPNLQKKTLLRLDLYSINKTKELAYSLQKTGDVPISDEEAAFGLLCVLAEVFEYLGNPEGAVETLDDLAERLGYENEQ